MGRWGVVTEEGGMCEFGRGRFLAMDTRDREEGKGDDVDVDVHDDVLPIPARNPKANTTDRKSAG